MLRSDGEKINENIKYLGKCLSLTRLFSVRFVLWYTWYTPTTIHENRYGTWIFMEIVEETVFDPEPV